MATPSRPEMVTAGTSPAAMGDVVTLVVVEVVLSVVVELGSNWGRMGKGYDGSVFL